MEKELKQRNGCISVWLWLAIIFNIAMTVFYAVTIFSAGSGEQVLGFGLCSILGVVNVLSAILLLRWNKAGFYLFVVSSIFAIVIYICVLKMEPVSVIVSLIAIFIWWAILQAKKDGVSAWSQLQAGWDGKHCRHLYQLFGVIGLLLLILTMIAFGNVGRSIEDSEYEDVKAVNVADDEVMSEEEVADVVVVDTVADQEDHIIDDDPSNSRTGQDREEKPIQKDSSEDKKRVSGGTPTSSDDDTEDLDKLEYIKQEIKLANNECPVQVAEGLIMKRMYLDGDYVMSLVECDEDLYDIDIMNMNMKDLSESVKESIVNQSSDPQWAFFVKTCIDAHKGFGYKYQGDTTGKSCIVKISYLELKKYLSM